MAGVFGLRGADIAVRDALVRKVDTWYDADRPYVRPHTGSPVLYLKEGEPTVERHLFGFSKRFSSFNARDDRLESGKMWSRMFGHDKGHGVAPVSYILEWADLGDGKRPYRIQRADGAAMAVPALVGASWEEEGARAFALVTIQPNRFVGMFHDRLIGQLDDDQIDTWLAPEKHNLAQVRSCLRAPADEELVAYPLRHDAGKARYDDPTMVEPTGDAITWQQLKDRAQGSRQATL